MNVEQARQRLQQLRKTEGRKDPQELAEIWAALPPVRCESILGEWRGEEIDTGHAFSPWLKLSGWQGKRFNSAMNVNPYLTHASSVFPPAAALTDNQASLWMVEFRGEVTATMIYDRIPVLDHFKKVDDATLLGVTNGKDVVPGSGRHGYFVLERQESTSTLSSTHTEFGNIMAME